MFFVLVGVVLVLMRWQEVGPVATWSWWWVLLPFALAAAWWHMSDAMGLTRKREMDKQDQRKEDRRRKAMEALGMDWRAGQKVRVFKDTRKREAERNEADREAKRQQQKDVVQSGFGSQGAGSAGHSKAPGSGHATDEDTRLP